MNKIVFSGLEEYSPEDLFRRLPSPSYVIDETQLECNGFCLLAVAERTGCKVLLAQKAFSNYNFYPLLEPYLAGTEASGLYEARLGKEEMGGKEVHVFCAAYREDEFDELLEYADHIVFNSPGQLKKLGERAKAQGKSIGLRVNPECSTQDGHDIYDPCGQQTGNNTRTVESRNDGRFDLTAGWNPFPYAVRTECRCTGSDDACSGRQIRGYPSTNEMGESGRWTSYYQT